MMQDTQNAHISLREGWLWSQTDFRFSTNSIACNCITLEKSLTPSASVNLVFRMRTMRITLS